MAAMNSVFRPVLPNRRRRVRHKIQTPAYASFTAATESAMLDLHEIVDISEDGMAIQCHPPLEVKARVDLCLDLVDCADHIYTTGQVIWSSPSGRAGLRFSELSPDALSRLREWLFVNVMAGVSHGESRFVPLPALQAAAPPRPNYSDTLAAIRAVQRQVDLLADDLTAALQLVAERAQTLVRASGAAIALAEADPDFMVCRASSGPDAPPVGARLQVGSGFSGECVKSGTLLRCDDTEFDPRVDRESCQALGIRSMLAVPVRAAENSIGILEVFSTHPDAFSYAADGVLQSLAESVLAAVNRASRAKDLPPVIAAPKIPQFVPTPGSVLFASAPAQENSITPAEEKISSGITLPRSHLVLLICAAAAIALVLGYNLAPFLQSRFEARERNSTQSVVLASSQPPKTDFAQPSPSTPVVETASIDELRQMAQAGDPVAENALGLRYFQGDEKNGISRDEKQAFHYFCSAAEHGSLAAQSKLGFLYWGGRGVPKDVNQAYFWTLLARARGDEENRDLAAVLASGMSRSQARAIEQQADLWLQQHLYKKPGAGRLTSPGNTASLAPSR